MQKYFMQRMQNEAKQKLNKADENCEIKQQLLWSVTFIFVTEKNKNKLYGGATTKNIKKIKVRGFTYYISKLSVFTI